MGKNTTNDMTQGNCMRLLVQFFLPILAGNLFQQLYSFADSMVVGKGIGDTALAAVGNTGSVHFLIIGFAIGLTGGLGICISQSFGSGNYEKLRKELAMSVWICLAVGIVITVVSLVFMRQLFTFLHTPEDLMTETLQYFGTILAGTTITIFNNFAMTLLRSVGNSRVPLVAMIISAIANVLMDLLFVFPLHMGVFGAALATVLAQVLSALYCCYYIGREKNLIPKKMDWKNEKQLQYVLSHEYVHIYRYDTVTKLIATLALCIHWFNPFVWVMYILFNRDIELACDESVIRQFGEKSKSAYSLMLINMEATKSGLLPFCNSFSKNAIEERITAIMKTKKTTIFSLVLACLIVVGVATAFATSAQANNNPIFEEQEYKPIHASENASDYDTAAELPGGNIDYGIYEEYGLIYDKNSKCYTYKGNVVRFFNDPVGGASFTNFFTGTVDIEAERDTNDKLIGIRECTKEVYDRHTEKYENSGLKSMPAGTSTENGDMIRNHESYSMESGDKTENMNTLQDYESYGIVYHPKDGYWYYNDQIIGIFIDTKKPIIYFNNSGSIYLSIAENSENGVMEIKEISEAEAQKLLRDNNSGNSASFTVETLK